MGSEQIDTGFEVISDQNIRIDQPDLFKGRSGFKDQIDSTRCPRDQDSGLPDLIIFRVCQRLESTRSLTWAKTRSGPDDCKRENDL